MKEPEIRAGLNAYMQTKGVGVHALAQRVDVPEKNLQRFLLGKFQVSAAILERCERFLKGS